MTNNLQSIKDIKSKRPRWGFYILWVFANGLGTIIGVIILFLLMISLGFLGVPLPEQQTKLEGIWKMVIGISIVSIPFGGIIGVMQWIVLRKHITNSGFWFTTSAVAMFIGFSVSGVIQMFGPLHQFPDLFFSWFFFGGVSGVLQWFIMRKQINYSGLWILVNVIAGIIAGVLLPDLGIIGGVIGWTLSGILTGGMLFILFVNTKEDYGSQIVA